MRVLAVIAGAPAALLLTGTSYATPSARLIYVQQSGAERCPDEQQLRSAVAARLGYDPFFPTAQQTVIAEISRAKRGFRGRVEVVDDAGHARGERVIDSASEDCAEMMRSLALAISIAVDDLDVAPAVKSPAPPPSSSPAPPPPPPQPNAAPIEAPSPSPSPAPAPGARVSFEATLGALGAVGIAPAFALGTTASVGMRWRALGFQIEGRYDAPASSAVVDGGRVRSSRMTGSAAACAHAGVPFACVRGALGSFHGEATDIAAPQSGERLFASAGIRLGLSVPIASAFFAQATVDLDYTLTRISVEIDARDAFSLPAITGALGVQAGVHF